jgi:hypothetical protein
VAPMISWIGVCCLMFAAIVPSTPGEDPDRGSARRLDEPAGHAHRSVRAECGISVPTSNLLLMHYPDYVMVGIAVVISVVVTRLGQQVISRARDGELPPRRAPREGRNG